MYSVTEEHWQAECVRLPIWICRSRRTGRKVRFSSLKGCRSNINLNEITFMQVNLSNNHDGNAEFLLHKWCLQAIFARHLQEYNVVKDGRNAGSIISL